MATSTLPSHRFSLPSPVAATMKNYPEAAAEAAARSAAFFSSSLVLYRPEGRARGGGGCFNRARGTRESPPVAYAAIATPPSRPRRRLACGVRVPDRQLHRSPDISTGPTSSSSSSSSSCSSISFRLLHLFLFFFS